MDLEKTILKRLDDGTLIRHKWTDTDAKGRELACLLAAVSPEVAKTKRAAACPASIMPSWLAHLTPWIDDAGTEERWPEFVKRYAWCAGRWSVLDAKTWGKLDYTCRLIAVEKAREYATGFDDVLKAIDDVIVLLKRAIAGEEVTEDEWKKAEKAARAEEAVWAEAAWAEAEEAAWAEAEAEEAAWAAWAARAAARAAWAARAAARAARARAADEMIDAMLLAIESEIKSAVQRSHRQDAFKP